MDGKAAGLITALELVGGGADLGLGQVVQEDMFEPADAPRMLTPKGKSGPQGGRPLGARNKSTEEWRAYLLSRYRNPIIGLLEICGRTPRELCEELELYVMGPFGPIKDAETGQPILNLKAAFDRQQAALEALLPYFNQKQPIAVETNGKSAGVIVIGDIGGLAKGGEGMLSLTINRPQQNQDVIDVPSTQSDAQQSDAGSKANDIND